MKRKNILLIIGIIIIFILIIKSPYTVILGSFYKVPFEFDSDYDTIEFEINVDNIGSRDSGCIKYTLSKELTPDVYIDYGEEFRLSYSSKPCWNGKIWSAYSSCGDLCGINCDSANLVKPVESCSQIGSYTWGTDCIESFKRSLDQNKKAEWCKVRGGTWINSRLICKWTSSNFNEWSLAYLNKQYENITLTSFSTTSICLDNINADSLNLFIRLTKQETTPQIIPEKTELPNKLQPADLPDNLQPKPKIIGLLEKIWLYLINLFKNIIG